MKILVLAYYIDGSAQGGGSGRFMQCVADTLANMGHEVTSSTEPEKYVDRKYDLIICSHFLHRIEKNPAPKICISHGIIQDEWIYPGAQKYVSISEEIKAHNLHKYGMYSSIINQPIEIRERKRPSDILKNILVIRRQNPEEDPFAFLAEKYDLKYSNPEIPVEDQIALADLCITLGRGALEAMAQGKPVLVADNRDYQGAIGDGYITPENINEIAKNNFSGRRYQTPLTQEWIEGELAKYNPDDSEILHKYVSENHEATKIMGDYLSMVEDVHMPNAGQTGLMSIIIPILNRHEMSQECIQTVMESTENYEIIVIDNGSDPPFQPPFSGFNELRVIRNEENKGFPVAINQGIREAKGDVIVLLNNDVTVTPGWAEHLINHLETYAIVGPITNFCAGIQNVIAQTYNSVEELNEVAEAIYEEHQDESENVNFIIGFAMTFKKSLYNEIGLFDESLWPCSGEEIDFCFRAVEAGYKVGIAWDVYVHHEGSQTFNDMVEAGNVDYGKLCERNDKHLAEKWGVDFWNNQLRYGKTRILGEGALRLNLGCGIYPLKGFVNIDQLESVKPDLLADVTDLPYAPDSVDEIYCGHMLEHLSWDEGQAALRHWLSILKRGGEIRVVVPNFDVLASIYFANPTPSEMKYLNDYFIYSYVQESLHRYFYSDSLLKFAMEKAGFKRLERLPMDHPYSVKPVDWQVGYLGVKS